MECRKLGKTMRHISVGMEEGLEGKEDLGNSPRLGDLQLGSCHTVCRKVTGLRAGDDLVWTC